MRALRPLYPRFGPLPHARFRYLDPTTLSVTCHVDDLLAG